jgi:hypothetical protein
MVSIAMSKIKSGSVVFAAAILYLTFPVKSEDSSEERCYAGVDLMIEMEWAYGFR